MFQLVSVLATASLSFLGAAYWFQRAKRAKDAETLALAQLLVEKRLNDLERQSALLGQAVLPISTAFQQLLIKELTHPHTPELDHLLTLVGPPCQMTPAEQVRFTRLLAERAHDRTISALERDAAVMLPLVMRRATFDLEHLGELPLILKVVSVAVAPDEARPL